ncbi:MAG: DUF3977 family protein, partial [Rickettsiales bacterium]|nr:DUF3977 family protein [Rickettsiales bacterium]
MKKIFIEYGLDPDNHKYLFGKSTEIESPDGTEIRTKENIKEYDYISWYIRIWFFKYVFSLDGKDGFRFSKKKRNNL